MQLGRKIRDLRCRRGLTVHQLAAASGLSKGFISQVENDRTSPSLASLRDMARALETSIAYLLVEDEQVPCVVRENQRPRIQFNGSESRVEVLSARHSRNLELLMTALPPETAIGPSPSFDRGEQCLVCLEGQVIVTYGGHRLELSAGDSCHFDGRVPHTIENHGSNSARVLLAIAPLALELAGPPSAARSHTNGVEVAPVA
jgi:transcriptional regulator with XRE-family HTH domain